MHRQDEDLGLRVVLQHLPGGFQPIQGRHADVKNGDIRFEFQGFFHGLASIAGLRRHFPPRLSFQKGAQPFPHDFVIVRYQEPQGFHPLPP